jgi:hypothetical protein
MDKQLFDLLKKPQQLNWLEAAIIRDGLGAGSEFDGAYGASVESAERILFAWEAAQLNEWDRDVVCQFLDPEIFPNRKLVQLRVEAALPERFHPILGLRWREERSVSMTLLQVAELI